jgi:hypothetical protein
VNKPKAFLILAFILATALVITVTVAFYHVPYTTQNYEESEDILVNPSRGFYVQFDTAHLQQIGELDNSGITLVLLAYDLKDYVDQELSAAKLNELSRALGILQAHGLKAIFRAAYGFDSAYEYQDPSSIDIIKQHLSQITPILSEYKSVLLSVQAGFLGPWGEWHHSNLGEDGGVPTAAIINELLVALCDAVPQSISIAVRRPSFIRLVDPEKIDLGRIAYHDDALLSSASDMGTYDQADYSREDELNYIYDRPYPLANGGEMPVLSEYTEPSVALNELTLLKLTYLNHEYNKDVISDWQTRTYQEAPFLDLIKKKLGYRWFIHTSTLPEHFKDSQSVKISLTLMNTGFSAVALPYRAELILSDGSGIRQVIPFEGVNLQDLKPDGSLSMSVSIKVNDLNEGFRLGLRILESDTVQVTDERLLVRLANTNMTVKDGITYFAQYEWDGENSHTLIITKP